MEHWPSVEAAGDAAARAAKERAAARVARANMIVKDDEMS